MEYRMYSKNTDLKKEETLAPAIRQWKDKLPTIGGKYKS